MKQVEFTGICIFSNTMKNDGRRTRQVPPQTQRTLQNTSYKHLCPTAKNFNPTVVVATIFNLCEEIID